MNKLHYPKPRRLNEELFLETVDRHRRFDCVFYDFCLDHACDFVYQSFSCKGCTYYYKSTTSLKEIKGYEEMAMEILQNKNNGG